MNNKIIEGKIEDKYGISVDEFTGLSVKDIKNLQIQNKLNYKVNPVFKLVKTSTGFILKNAAIGVGTISTFNTLFQDETSKVLNYLSSNNDLSKVTKIIGLGSNITTPIGTICLGASLGLIISTGFKLLNTASNEISIRHDKRLVKKIK